MAKDGKHVVHAGGVFPNPMLNAEGNADAATLPGTVVCHSATGLAKAAGTEGKIFYVADIDYLKCNGIDTANAIGENMVAIQPLPGMFLNVRSAATQTYTKGAMVAITAAGRVKLGVVGTDTQFAYAEESLTITTADDLVRVVFK